MGKTNLGFVASVRFIKAEPELTRKIVRAHVVATKELVDNPAIAVETTIKQFKMTKEVAEASTGTLFFSTEPGARSQDGLNPLAGMRSEEKMREGDPAGADFINPSFLRGGGAAPRLRPVAPPGAPRGGGGRARGEYLSAD